MQSPIAYGVLTTQCWLDMLVSAQYTLVIIIVN